MMPGFENSLNVEIRNLRGVAGVVIESLKEKSVTFAWNDCQLFPAASLIKLPIMWKVFKEIESSHLSLSQKFLIDQSNKVGGFGVLKELHSGISLSLEDLVTLMIIISDNTATNFLIDLLGMDAINQTIRKIGMKQTSLQRKMMDLEAKQKGLDNFTCPSDIAIFFKKLLFGQDPSCALREKMLDILKRQQCNNKLPLGLPKGAILAHKTGDLSGTEHDVGVLYHENDPRAFIIVLTKDLVDNEDGIRFCQYVAREVFTELDI